MHYSSLWPVEVGSVLLAVRRRGRIRSNFDALPIEVEPVSTVRVWGTVLELADQHRLSVYDSTCLELAPRMRLPLATLDRALAAAARTAGVYTPATP